MSRTTFACPECGELLTVAGSSAGREVRCPSCDTAVEVPFLPRTRGPSRSSRSNSTKAPWTLRAAWALAAVLAVVLVTGLATRFFRLRAESSREARVEALLKAASDLERSGRVERAFIEAEAALDLCKTGTPLRPEIEKQAHDARNRLSVVDARKKLEAAETIEPRRAVTDCLTLRVRAESDRALAPLVTPIEEALVRARGRLFQADLAAARSAFQEGRSVDALGLLESLHILVSKLPEALQAKPNAEIEELARRVVGEYGIMIRPFQGQYQLGSPGAYETAVGPAIRDVVKAKGYLQRPAQSPFAPLWELLAPYQLVIELSESYTMFYLQSQSRISEIRGLLRLFKGKEQIWLGEITSRTRVPVEGLPALIASRLAVADKRLPEAEKRLYDDAFSAFVDQAGSKLRGLPVPAPPQPNLVPVAPPESR